MFYVYRFLNKKGFVIYIGKTQDLDNRVYSHIENGHLPLSCYKEVDKIEYLELPTRVDMDIVEVYLINLYKPLYNKLDVENDALWTVLHNNFVWKPYTKTDFKLLLKYKNELRECQNKNSDLQKKYNRLLSEGVKNLPSVANASNPYYLNGLHSRLSYISHIISCDILPVKNALGLYNYKEVIQLLISKPELKFKSINKHSDIRVERINNQIKFTEITSKISENNCHYYVVHLDTQGPTWIGSYNLAGVVPFLHYNIDK